MPATPVTVAPPADLASRLMQIGQGHVFAAYERLNQEERASLIAQVRGIDLDAVPELVESYVKRKPGFALPPDVRPAPYYPNDSKSPVRAWDRGAADAKGRELINAGRVACFTVAGGQGTRLGYDGPKGCYPAGAVTRKPLFQMFAEQILAWSKRSGRIVPWYIMTSPLNHDATIAFMNEHGYFGLSREAVMCFPQGVLPSFDMATGRMLIASPSEIATNPDGHGGSITALHKSGAIADMKRRGITTLSYFQVDNATVRVIDPVFIGLHASAPDSSAEMSSKMIPKAYAEEKLGLFCSCSGRTEVIEYSDLPMELQREREPDGSLRFLAGSIAVHVMGVEFVERLATDAKFSLPFHRAEKKVACVDPATGARVEPTMANCVKLERFVFDALPMCRASIVYETDRVEEFAPIKNASGTDSPDSCTKLQTERAARWLKSVGVDVARNEAGEPECVLEIDPATALEPADLKNAKLPTKIERGAKLVI